MIDKDPLGQEPIPENDNNAPEHIPAEGADKDVAPLTDSPIEESEVKTEDIKEPADAVEVAETAEVGESISSSADETEEKPQDTPPPQAPEKTHGKAKAEAAPKKRGSTLIPLAAALSSVAIILLFTFLLFIMVGVALVGDNGSSSVIQIGGNNGQVNYTDDTEMIADFMDSVVVISVERVNSTGVGTGIVLTSDGYIVTNYHVVSETTAIYVKLYNNSDYVKATLIGYSEHDDVAVIKIDKDGLRAATFVADSNSCLLGERVYAIGSPEGTDYSWTVTQGIISSVNRDLKLYDNEGVLEKKMRVIQTDAAVNPGNSGGPIINSRGEVVGIVTLKLTDSAGMGFALPSDGVIPLVREIMANGNADNVESTIASGRPLMGILCVSVQKGVWYKNTEEGIEMVDESYAASHPSSTFYADEDGVYVKSTSQGMDAHGKLQSGDIITEINGTRVYTQYQLMAVINELHGGDSVALTVYRNGSYINVSKIQ